MGQDMKIVALPLPAEDAFFGAFVDLGNVLRCEKTVVCPRLRKPNNKDIRMNKLKFLLAAALLGVISNAASIAPPETANPGIFGNDWRLEMTGPPLASPAKADPCVYAGDLTLTRGALFKDAADKIIGEPVSGQAMVELVSGPCEEFPALLGDILGSAAGNDIIFQMSVFPVEPAKDGSTQNRQIGINFVDDLVNNISGTSCRDYCTAFNRSRFERAFQVTFKHRDNGVAKWHRHLHLPPRPLAHQGRPKL